jgi:transposase InsO family protein
MKPKSESFQKFKFFRRCVKFETNIRIKTLRSDRGGEFLSNNFSSFCEEHGV